MCSDIHRLSDVINQGLQETVACMCVIVKYLTHDFSKLVNLLRSCNGTSFVFDELRLFYRTSSPPSAKHSKAFYCSTDTCRASRDGYLKLYYRSFMRTLRFRAPQDFRRFIAVVLSFAATLNSHVGPLASELKQITRVSQNCISSLDIGYLTPRKGPIIEHVFGVLLKLYHKYNDQALRGRILHCLGK